MPPLHVILPLLALLQGVHPQNNQGGSGHGRDRGQANRQAQPSPLAKGLGGLTQKLYLEMVRRSGQGNFVFSPLSLHSAMAMVFLGTDKNSASADEIKKVLGIESNRDSLGDSYQDLLDVYSRENSFLYGNAIWVGKDSQLKNSYRKKVTEKLGALVESVDFSQEQTLKNVNGWVNKKTNGKIKEIVKSFSPGTPMFLANALYFKEKWKTPFDDARTPTSPFHPLGRNTIQVPMMELASNQTIYREIRNGTQVLAQVAIIPYENKLFEMEIILPTSAENMLIIEEKMRLSDKIDDLDSQLLENPISFNVFSDLNHLAPQYDAEKVYVKMPLFNVKTDLEADQVLQKLGAHRVWMGTMPFS
jgi:serpin B